MDTSICRSNSRSASAPGICFYVLPYPFHRYGESHFSRAERILVQQMELRPAVPFMSLFSYHRWCERPVRQQDIVVFNNPAGIGQPIIDRREIYISRCIGTPGRYPA